MLLLKKWQNESSDVVLVVLWGYSTIPPYGSMQMRGQIFRLDESKRFFAVAAPNALENIAMINYAGCKFVYEADPSFDFLRSTEALRQFTAATYDEVAFMITPEEVKISLYLLKPQP